MIWKVAFIFIFIQKGNELARNDWKNWRPISLTNNDYKLLAKCLSLRLSSVNGEIMRIKLDIKSRRVSRLICLINDVTELTVQQKPGLLLTVHYSQAFEFDIIFKDCEVCLWKKWFWSRLFYNANGSVCWCPIQKVVWITVDGSLFVCVCRFWHLSRLPIFLLAFVSAIELLAIKIRMCKI